MYNSFRSYLACYVHLATMTEELVDIFQKEMKIQLIFSLVTKKMILYPFWYCGIRHISQWQCHIINILEYF